MEKITEEAKSYIRGYNNALDDAIKMLSACSESLQNMKSLAKAKFEQMGIDIGDLFNE